MMKLLTKIVFLGIGVWAIPFAVGMVLFQLQESLPILFDTLMSVSVSAAAILFSVVYLRTEMSNSASVSLSVGFLWMFVCILIDVPLFLFGFGMELKMYVADVGTTYLMIPITLSGMAYASRMNTGKRRHEADVEIKAVV